MSEGTVVWVNGRFVEQGTAQVSAFDAGITHGVGLFETMHACRGRVFRAERHLARLAGSAEALGLSRDLRTRALEEAVQACVERSGLASGDAHARVRLTLTGGDLNLLTAAQQGGGEAHADPTIIIHVTRATPYPDEMFDRGVGVLIAEPKANPLNPNEGHKTIDYWWRLRALQAAAGAGMGEALVLQVSNHVAGGAVSNLFVVKDGALLTPLARGEEDRGALPSPVLPGVTRDAVTELADAAGVGTSKRLLTIDDVLDADELFLTNASWGVLPVVNVEKRAIASGAPGEVTRLLRERWLEAMRHEA
jgi:branched-chain amino acid aminotransferase